ncbi:hypothetical protein CGJ89_24040 [Vibrio parahaemolyticus]|nr:hypothetical protein CGJ89_24040 [Vibrio parahaemolyticus]
MLIGFQVTCVQTNLNTRGKLRLTRRLRRIHNAWRFQFKLNFVFKVQWFGGWRCSPLNVALNPRRLNGTSTWASNYFLDIFLFL